MPTSDSEYLRALTRDSVSFFFFFCAARSPKTRLHWRWGEAG